MDLAVCLKNKLLELWNEIEGRILLINLAGQTHSNVIGRKQLDHFLKRASRSDSDFSSRKSALKSDPPGMMSFAIEDLHFASNVGPADAGEVLLLRVAPMGIILNNIQPENDVNSKKRFGRAKATLRSMGNLKMSDAKFMEFENRFLTFLFEKEETAQIFVNWDLGTSWRPQLYANGHLRMQTIGFRKKDGRPVFFAPADRCVDFLKTGNGVSASADTLRDKLGLDYLGKSYKDHRVILGWYCFRLKQLSDSTSKRPTPFDNTSRTRFKAVYGDFGKIRGSMGRTADLSKIGVDDSIEGPPEIVCPNEVLKLDENEVFFGYLGSLNVPRNDTYNYTESGNELDHLFIENCLGAWDRDAVIDTVLGAIEI